MGESFAIPQPSGLPEAIEQALIAGDLSALSTEDRLIYYQLKCKSLGLNPLSRPFEYLKLNGKLVLYALKDAKEQLRKIHGVSLEIVMQERQDTLYVVRVRATTPDGRHDEDMGFADLSSNPKGDALGNAMLKAVTKAKSRATLSICGLGMIDESEVESVPGAVVYQDQQAPVSLENMGDENDLPAAIHPTADQVNSLVELIRVVGLHVAVEMHAQLDLPPEVTITKKVIRERMTMDQYDRAWMFYSHKLKDKDDVPDFSGPAPEPETGPLPQEASEGSGEGNPPSSEAIVAQESDESPRDHTPDAESSEELEVSDRKHATEKQMARLKLLASRVGDDDYADLQDRIEHEGGRLTLRVYEEIRAKLLIHEAEQQEKSTKA